MAEQQAQQSDREDMVDPIAERPGFDQTQSQIAIFGHPIHAMSVAFPIALAFCALGADLFYWWTGDVFWARAALWATGTGFLFGMLAGFSGTAELLFVSGIRARSSPWCERPPRRSNRRRRSLRENARSRASLRPRPNPPSP